MNENVTLTKTEAPSYSEATSAYTVALDGVEIGVVYKTRISTPLMTSNRGLHYTYGSSVRTAWTWTGPGFRSNRNTYRLDTRTRTQAIARLIEEATR